MGHFRLGMRTIKTGIAVMLCILVFHLFNRENTNGQMIAAIAAVFALRQDMSTTWKFSKTRVLSNTIGAVAALFYILIQHFFHQNFWVELICVPLFVILIIVFSDGIDYNDGIIGANATLLIIIFTIPAGSSAFYAIDRVVDTFIGTFIAILVNYFIRPSKKGQLMELREHAAELMVEEASLKEEENDLLHGQDDTKENEKS